MKLYKIAIRDNIPELVPVSSSGTFQTPDGKTYWIFPAESIPVPTPTPIPTPIPEPTPIPQEPQATDEERVIALLKKGVKPISEIARRANLTPYAVTQIIHAAGLETPSEILRAKIEETLRKAGAAGMSTYEIGKITHSSHQIGPMMAGMLRRGEAWRLANGNYAMYQPFNPAKIKEGNP